MKRAQLLAPQRPLVTSETPIVPEPPDAGLVVKTAFCGICQTDLHQTTDQLSLGGSKVMNFSSAPFYNFPKILGHEVSGWVHSLGKNHDSELELGDRVVIYPWIACGDCDVCNNDCSFLCDVGSNKIGLAKDGGYCSHVVLPSAKYAIKLPPNLPLDVASMLPCSALTSFNALQEVTSTVQRFTTLHGCSSVLIIGAGGLGLWCIGLARLMLPSGTRIVVADCSIKKLEIARQKSVDDVIHWPVDDASGDLVTTTIAKSASAAGYCAIIDFVASSSTSHRAMSCLRKGGHLVSVGLYGGSIEVELPRFVIGMRKFQGLSVGSLAQLREVISIVEQGKVDVPKMSYFKLEEINSALEMLGRGEIEGRGIIKFQQ